MTAPAGITVDTPTGGGGPHTEWQNFFFIQ